MRIQTTDKSKNQATFTLTTSNVTTLPPINCDNTIIRIIKLMAQTHVTNLCLCPVNLSALLSCWLRTAHESIFNMSCTTN